jgi:hypothetical protein
LIELVYCCRYFPLPQHAHPGGLLHLALALMQVFPRGWPLAFLFDLVS